MLRNLGTTVTESGHDGIRTVAYYRASGATGVSSTQVATDEFWSNHSWLYQLACPSFSYSEVAETKKTAPG